MDQRGSWIFCTLLACDYEPERRVYEGKAEHALKKKDAEIARLQKRLAETDQVHQAELDRKSVV